MFLSILGKGGFPWEDAYRMPVRVRKMCVSRLQEILEKEANPPKSQNNVPKIHHGPGITRMPQKTSPKINRPNASPKNK